MKKKLTLAGRGARLLPSRNPPNFTCDFTIILRIKTNKNVILKKLNKKIINPKRNLRWQEGAQGFCPLEAGPILREILQSLLE